MLERLVAGEIVHQHLIGQFLVELALALQVELKHLLEELLLLVLLLVEALAHNALREVQVNIALGDLLEVVELVVLVVKLVVGDLEHEGQNLLGEEALYLLYIRNRGLEL